MLTFYYKSTTVAVLLLFSISTIFGQDDPIDQISLDAFEVSNELLDGFQNDSAIIVLTGLLKQLEEKDLVETPFGLKAQLNMAEAMERDHRDEIAISKLYEIAEKGEQMSQWDIYVNAQLTLARIHEKRNRPESCLKDLNHAMKIIDQEGLDFLYPRYAIRRSSYHRIYASKDSALYFANEVLRTAPKYKQFEFNAVGNMLMGMLESDKSFEKAKKHYLAAAAFWKGSGDYSGYGSMMSGLTNLHLKERDFNKAKYYNDKYLESIRLGETIGVEPTYRYGYAYLTRSNIFQRQGLLDSAIYYKEKGYELEIESINKNNDAKVFEIESKYLGEKKAEQIKKQELALEKEKQQRNYILALLFLALFSAGLLTYYYLKLKRSNEKTISQSNELKSVNEALNKSLDQQIALRGEMHHRVKNNIQIMLSLLELQIDEVEDLKAKDSFNALSERLYSMSAIHELLNESETESMLSLEEYATNLCRHFSNLIGRGYSFNFNLDINDQIYNLATLTPLGIILSELLMNSLKHASPKNKELLVDIKHSIIKDLHQIVYSDNGVGFGDEVKLEENQGIGMYLINSMARQLEGYVETANQNGAKVTIFYKEKNQMKE